MFALADANNFYASCERVFNPALIDKAIVVLSNNDGCVIARSNEAKALGIKMGTPFYQIKELVNNNLVTVFSSNYILYGDMSQRIMNLLSCYVPDIEVYSIDEAFLDLRSFERFDLVNYGESIVRAVFKGIGVPLSMGIAPTKTLAKVAAKYAKKMSKQGAVKLIKSKDEIEEALRNFSIEDVWGIGRQYAKSLISANITTALEFSKCNKDWVRKHFSVVGERTWNELNGISCIAFEYYPPEKKQICTSRSFSPMIDNYNTLSEAVASYAVNCAAKLRKQESAANTLMVFIATNRHRKDLPHYFNSKVLKLPLSTSDSSVIANVALTGLKEIFKENYLYKQAGVIVSDIIDQNSIQTNLFVPLPSEEKKKLMDAMDSLNEQYGRETVKIGAEGYRTKSLYNRTKVSPCFSTKLKDCIIVNAQ